VAIVDQVLTADRLSAGLPPSNRGVTHHEVGKNTQPSLKPRFDYFQAQIKADYHTLVRGLVTNFAAAEPVPQKGYHGYGMGISIPTRDRGTLTVNPAGTHDHPAVRVSGWPSDDVVAYVRRWEGQASRVDAAVDFAGDLGPWCEVLVSFAEGDGLKWGSHHVGKVSTGVELGAGKSESRTRCYDAALAHPGEFSGPTGRLEHEWKPSTRERKGIAYLLDPGAVLGTSRPARTVVEALAGVTLGAAPGRTRRVSDLDRWRQWMRDAHAARLDELLAHHDGDLLEFARDLLGLNESD
jgi:hypothetical protein